MRRKRTIELFIFILFFSSIAALSLYPTFLWWRNTPPYTTFSFSYGHTGDYFQLVHFVQSGMHGKLLYTIPYTEDSAPSMFVQPIYFFTGLILSPFIKSPIIALFILRLVSLAAFFSSLTILLYRVLKTFILRFLAGVVAVGATSFWTVASEGGQTVYHTPVEWNDTFNIYRKFLIPPHHLLAIACVMLLLIVFSSRRWRARQVIFTIVLTTFVGLLHPYHLSLVCGIAVIGAMIIGIQKKKVTRALDRMVPVLVPAGIIYVYYNQMTQLVFPWIRPDTLLSIITPQPIQTLWPYILAIGPIFFLSLLFVIPLVKSSVSFIELLLLLWAGIPFIASLFPGTKIMQPFKTHQYIPLAILAVCGISYVVREKKIMTVVVSFLVGATFIYAYFPYAAAFQKERTYIAEAWGDFTAYMPDSLLRTFTFLNRQTPKNSVILAGEQVSFMIPAFTQDKVVIGQGDSVANYADRVSQVRTDYYGYDQGYPDGLITFAKSHRVSYILFGVDASLFNPSVSPQSVQVVYNDTPVTVVKVLQ